MSAQRLIVSDASEVRPSYMPHSTPRGHLLPSLQTSDPCPAAAQVPKGTRVEVDAQGDWWDAEVIKVKQGQAKVHYEGGTEAEQEWIAFDRFSPESLYCYTTRL